LAIRRVDLPPGVKLVALTFDLCEQPREIAGYQGATIDFLRENNIRATFFAGGKWMLTHRNRAEQLMSDPLFEVGNHTWEHRNLRLLSGKALEREIGDAQVSYEKVREELQSRQCLARDGQGLAHERAPGRMALFRFPFGACNDASLNAVADMGLATIQWDVSSGDPWPGQRPELMVKAVLSHVRPGSIVLFHANGRGWHTSEALPSIVGELRKRGYGFVTVSELLALGKPVAEPRCYDSRPGDTDRYDGLARRLENRRAERTLSAISAEDAAPTPTSKPKRR
jgi:peptidoglycan/xylan/chitin deacetylase (PgdA/CDA1 family)